MTGLARSLAVIQHTSSEYLGLIEDHLEGRQIRFAYYRPFIAGGRLPRSADATEGLVLLGGGPWGVSEGAWRLPWLGPELELAAAALSAGTPVLGFGLGAQILALAAGATVTKAPLALEVATATRTAADALGGLLPAAYPLVRYGRDEVSLPGAARVLARDDRDRWALFQLGERAFGFAGHPGVKSAIIEDLIMEFIDSPPATAAALAALRAVQPQIETTLVSVMAGLTRALGLMKTGGDKP